MVKVNYICIGAQKSGTTSLINYLNLHPEIYMIDKEIHLFDLHKKITKSDIKNYENQFKSNLPLIGEKSPSYCFIFSALKNIYKYNNNIKLILLLREPISRAFSQHNMKKMDGRKNYLSLNNIIKNYNKNKYSLVNLNKNNKNMFKLRGGCFIERGFYDEIINFILKIFPRENFYIGIAEEIMKNKLVEYNKIYKFLGAKELDNLNYDENTQNTQNNQIVKKKNLSSKLDTNIRKYNHPIDSKHKKELYRIFKPHNQKLYKLLGRKIDIWEDYYKSFQA